MSSAPRGAVGSESHHRRHGNVLGFGVRGLIKPAHVRPGLAQFRDMSHTHVAGSIHADSTARAPSWLSMPSDVNSLLPTLWSAGVRKDEPACSPLPASVSSRSPTGSARLSTWSMRLTCGREHALRRCLPGLDVYYAAKSFLCTTVARWVSEEDSASMSVPVVSWPGAAGRSRSATGGPTRQQQSVEELRGHDRRSRQDHR